MTHEQMLTEYHTLAEVIAKGVNIPLFDSYQVIDLVMAWASGDPVLMAQETAEFARWGKAEREIRIKDWQERSAKKNER